MAKAKQKASKRSSRSRATRARASATRTRRSSDRRRQPRSTQARGRTRRPAAKATRARASVRRDAITVLQADHQKVRNWFAQFFRTRSVAKKRDLAIKICTTMLVHSKIEEEIFYPAFLEATGEMAMHHQAEVEHDGARKLIAQIEATDPRDSYHDARVMVLSTMIEHHLNEEERPDGMFAMARKSGMDLRALGRQLAARRAELMSGVGVMARRATAKARGAADQAVSGIAERLGLQ